MSNPSTLTLPSPPAVPVVPALVSNVPPSETLNACNTIPPPEPAPPAAVAVAPSPPFAKICPVGMIVIFSLATIKTAPPPPPPPLPCAAALPAPPPPEPPVNGTK